LHLSTSLSHLPPPLHPHTSPYTTLFRSVANRIAAVDWATIAQSLDAHGCATTNALLAPDECAALAGRYDTDALYRRRVVMARHRSEAHTSELQSPDHLVCRSLL